MFVVALLMADVGVADPLSVQSRLSQLTKLSESNPDQAVLAIAEFQTQFPQELSDTDRRDLMLIQLQLALDKGNRQQANDLISKLTQLGHKNSDPVANFMVKNFQARMYGEDGKFGEGLAIIEPILEAVKKGSDRVLQNQIENTAGQLYSSIGNFQIALEHHLSALDALQPLKEGEWQTDLIRAKTLNSIGQMYLSLKDDSMALDYFHKAKDGARQLEAPGLLSSIANNTGFAYADQENWTAAITAYEESLTISKKIGNHNAEAKGLNNLADASLNQEKYPDCVRFAEQSLRIANQYELKNTAAIAETNLGICHIYMGEIEKGIAEDKLGIDFARSANAKPTLEGMLTDLANAYKKTGMYREALKTLEERDQIINELFHADRDRAMIEMKVHFDLSQHQKEIEKLEQKNALQHVEIENKNLQRIVSVFLIATAVMAVVGIFFLYRRVRQSNLRLRAANLKLKDQSTRDPLTGLLNRRAFQNMIDSFNLENDRRMAPDSGLHDVLVLLDIDHFKRINDTYGHPAGDSVLVEIGRRLQKILREKDMLMRWGGEEFLIYLHRVPLERVSDIVRRELVVVGATPIDQPDRHKDAMSVTISAGYILMPLPGAADSKLSWEKALKLVDLALYFAKSSGRNQAIGLESVKGTTEQIDAFLEGNLQAAVDSGVVELQRVKGV